MTSLDLFLTPIYLGIIYMLAYRFRNKNYPPGHPYRDYVIPGLTVKLIGAISAGLIYFFYYRYGDTVFYYERTDIIYRAFHYDFDTGVKLVFASASDFAYELSGFAGPLRGWDTSSYMVLRFSAPLALITGNCYSCIAVIFAYFSFRGIWALFVTFAELYPNHIRRIALACLFIPSVFFWGSGLFKDTITLAGVGWMTYSFYKVFIKREKILPNAIILIAAFYVTFATKAYIVLCFIPSVLFWIFLTYNSKIKNQALKVIIAPIIILFSSGLGYLFLIQIGAQNEYWSVDSISDRAEDMQWWHQRVGDLYGEEGGGGSTYTIGDGSFTLSNIIISFPQAINVSLFRPYLWEARNPVMFMSAIESLILFFFSLRVVFRAGIFRSFKLSLLHPVIFFCLFFSIFFAFAVGFTSFNFGALVRYKIPMMPFYVIGLSLLEYHSNKDKKRLELDTTE